MSNHAITSLINHNKHTACVLVECVGEIPVTDDAQHTTEKLIDIYGKDTRFFVLLQNGGYVELVHDGRYYVSTGGVDAATIAETC